MVAISVLLLLFLCVLATAVVLAVLPGGFLALLSVLSQMGPDVWLLCLFQTFAGFSPNLWFQSFSSSLPSILLEDFASLPGRFRFFESGASVVDFGTWECPGREAGCSRAKDFAETIPTGHSEHLCSFHNAPAYLDLRNFKLRSYRMTSAKGLIT